MNRELLIYKLDLEKAEKRDQIANIRWIIKSKEIPDVQAGFRNCRGIRDQIANICWIIEKAREFQENIYCFIDYVKAFDYVDHK